MTTYGTFDIDSVPAPSDCDFDRARTVTHISRFDEVCPDCGEQVTERNWVRQSYKGQLFILCPDCGYEWDYDDDPHHEARVRY